jgi:hypothetical protein
VKIVEASVRSKVRVKLGPPAPQLPHLRARHGLSRPNMQETAYHKCGDRQASALRQEVDHEFDLRTTPSRGRTWSLRRM